MSNLNRVDLDSRIKWLRAERADLLLQLDNQVATQDSVPANDLPHDWGIVGDLQRDIELLRQLLRLDG
jgi:hypothetical protein